MSALKSRIWILAILVMAVSAGSGHCAQVKNRFLLRDGFFLGSVDGRVIAADSNEGMRTYSFEFKSDVSDGRAIIKAGTRLELLPSSVLERLITGLDDQTGACRLWGHATRYRGKNYIFMASFLPLRTKPEAIEQDQDSVGPEQSEQVELETQEKESKDNLVNDPNDTVTIPENILEKLKGRKVRRPVKQDKTADTNVVEVKKPVKPVKPFKPDSVIPGRVGFVKNSRQTWTGGWSTEFAIDGSGRNLEGVSFELLPCEALEQTEDRLLHEPDRIRVKVAGLVTEFKGKKYLLLQRATRVYGYGNLGK
jgi:hypothetical protein